MKFLVLWQLEPGLRSEAMARAVARMPEYAIDLEARGKLLAQYDVVGARGGAWIYEVDSHEEFQQLLAMSPVFDFATYDVRALADVVPGGPPGGPVHRMAGEVVDSMGSEG